MDSIPPLSIVIPVLNEGEGIVDCLSVLAPYRARGAEVIVVDGGSTDGTPERVRPLADRLLSAPRGRAAQMNAGAAAASGTVLLFLHADTRLPEDADRLINKAIANGARWGRFDVTIAGEHRLLPLVALLMNHRSRLSGIATGDQAIFVARAVFEAVGGFPDQALMEDIELSARLRRHSRPACLYAKVTTSGRRWDRNGFWKTVFLMWRLRWSYWRGGNPERLARRYGYESAERAASRGRRRASRHRTALLVFAKAPIPGQAKTRLIPALGESGAAVVAERMIEDTLAKAAQAGFDSLQLWCTPATTHPRFQQLAAQYQCSLNLQLGQDLGDRMQHALATALADHHAAVLIGTDCPGLTVDDLLWARERITGPRDVAIVPVEDGGYVLIGMARPNPTLFSGIRWGTRTVFDETEARAAAAGLVLHRGPMRRDLDHPSDLDLLAEH